MLGHKLWQTSARPRSRRGRRCAASTPGPRGDRSRSTRPHDRGHRRAPAGPLEAALDRARPTRSSTASASSSSSPPPRTRSSRSPSTRCSRTCWPGRARPGASGSSTSAPTACSTAPRRRLRRDRSAGRRRPVRPLEGARRGDRAGRAHRAHVDHRPRAVGHVGSGRVVPVAARRTADGYSRRDLLRVHDRRRCRHPAPTCSPSSPASRACIMCRRAAIDKLALLAAAERARSAPTWRSRRATSRASIAASTARASAAATGFAPPPWDGDDRGAGGRPHALRPRSGAGGEGDGHLTIDGKRILVTGGTGSLGQRVVRRLLDGGDWGGRRRSPCCRATRPSSTTCACASCTATAATDDVIYQHARDLLAFRIGDVRDFDDAGRGGRATPTS